MFSKDSSDKDYKNTNHRISQLRIHSYYYLSNIYIQSTQIPVLFKEVQR